MSVSDQAAPAAAAASISSARASIRRDLLKWLIAPLLLLNLVGAGLTYWLAWLPAQHAFDQNLMDSTWACMPRCGTGRNAPAPN